MIGPFSISCCSLFTSLILTTPEIPVEYKLITSLPKAFPVFQPFSFTSRCLYSAYIFLIISSLVLSTFSCVHLCFPPYKYLLPLLIARFKHSRFICCSTPSFCVSTPHGLIYFLHQPLFLLHAKIPTI